LNPKTNNKPDKETELGKGNFGKVFKGSYNNHDVAVKEVSVTAPIGERECKIFAHLYSLMPHPFITRVFGYSKTAKHYCFVTEYIQGREFNGEYYTDLKSALEVNMQLDERKIMHQIANGMEFLHSNDIVHRDLACRNILLTAEGIKIADFGLSRTVAQGGSYYSVTRELALPHKIMAPESLCYLEWGKPSDVWSFACLAWQLITHLPPHWDKTSKDVLNLARYGRSIALPWDVVLAHTDLKSLMKECQDITKDRRPTFREILEQFDSTYGSLNNYTA